MLTDETLLQLSQNQHPLHCELAEVCKELLERRKREASRNAAVDKLINELLVATHEMEKKQ